jgi:hypothetical protein
MRVHASDYVSESRTDKVAVGDVSPWRPPDWKAVEEVLLLLARAVQQFHTYPPTSPLCVTALESCQRALAALETRDPLSFRVAPHVVIVDDIETGRGSLVEQEVAHRLHRRSVASVSVERDVTIRELTRFCLDLVDSPDDATGESNLASRLVEHGVDRIALQMAYRPEVFDVAVPSRSVVGIIERERTRREELLAKGGAVNHLYPPDKGWIRLDPAAAFPAVSLVELAILADDPAALAAMLVRLSDDSAPDDLSNAEALEQKFSDVAMLFAALDPRLARTMFSKLARAVLDLGPERRQALLRRTILPGLLDGKVDGNVLRDFPDMELAESLCLLLDLETAAPELLTTALARLDLPADRHAAMLPLLEEGLRNRETVRPEGQRQSALARHARELIRIGHKGGKSFAEFAAFDLALDPRTEERLEQFRGTVTGTDVRRDQLACLWNLTRLEPNPELVQSFTVRAFGLLAEIECAGRCEDLASWLAGHRALADSLRASRPDVSDVIDASLAGFCTVERAAWVAELAALGEDGRTMAGRIVEGLGRFVLPALVELLEREDAKASRGSVPARARAITQLLMDHAVHLAPAATPFLGHLSPLVRRTLARMLGLAGPGYETHLATLIGAGDEQTGREALKSLARIGTTEAAVIVAAEIEHQESWVGGAAEEALWRLPRAEALRQVRNLLSRREFTLRCPVATARLLDRAAQLQTTGLEPILRALAPMRFRFWNPSLARMARKAHALLNP